MSKLKMHDYKQALVRFTKTNNHSDCYDLKFQLEQNSFVPKWIDRINHAKQRQDPISEPWAMKGINKNLDPENCRIRLNELIDKVNSHERLFDKKLHNITDQDTLNQIHSVFEKHHGKLDDWLTNPLFENKPKEFREWLSQINQFVHLCEGHSCSANVRIVWFDLPKTEQFDANDYALFTNNREFGTIYSLYADVGKNIESLTDDNDDHHHDFVPNLHYSADCRIMFETLDENTVAFRELAYQHYIRDNQSYLQSKGYNQDDIRLTTGHIPLAKLITNKSERQILEELSDYDLIQDLILL